jgi:hypothetical protein
MNKQIEELTGKGIDDNLIARGSLTVELFGQDGKLKDKREVDNLIVTLGRAYIASRMKDTSQAAMGWIAIGTNSAAAAAGDSTLGAEVERNAASSTIITTDVTEDTCQYVVTFAPGVGAAALTEAGIFNAGGANAGIMLSRTVFDVVNKGALDTMTITWNIKIA